MKILAVGAHPDDLEFGMGGTLIKLAEEGHDVVGVVLTKGEMGTGGTDEIRVEEMKKAAKVAGYSLEIMDFQDTKVRDNPESREKLANIIRKHKPEVVFAPYHTNVASHRDGMAHPDHTSTGNLVRHTLRIAKFKKVKLEHEAHFAKHIIYYMVPRNRSPAFICDVTRQKDRLLEAMRAHESQINEQLIELLFIMRKSYGFYIGTQFGEAFIVEDPMKFDISLFKD